MTDSLFLPLAYPASAPSNHLDRRRRYLSLLHGTAPEPFRAILKPFLEANDMRALELIREEAEKKACWQAEKKVDKKADKKARPSPLSGCFVAEASRWTTRLVGPLWQQSA